MIAWGWIGFSACTHGLLLRVSVHCGAYAPHFVLLPGSMHASMHTMCVQQCNAWQTSFPKETEKGAELLCSDASNPDDDLHLPSAHGTFAVMYLGWIGVWACAHALLLCW